MDWDNVILLSCDALRADHLSGYGYHRETSPRLDGVSEECIQFVNAYSASSHTREAVPALLTGKYPDCSIDSNYHLATDTIASKLSDHGLATAGFHSNPFISRAYGFDQGFDVFDDDLHLGQHKLIALAQRALDKLRNRHYARAEEINDRSLRWLDSLDPGESFFLWNHYMDTHGPYEPPNSYATLYANQALSNQEAQSLYQRAVADPKSISKEERQLLIDLYDAEIRYNDKHIGNFLHEIKRRDLLDNTLLIITSDHGDAFGEHGYYEHPRYLHDEITHVPLLMRTPNQDQGYIESPVSTLDIVATLEESFGCSNSDGMSLFNASNDNRVFSQARGEDDHSHLRRYAVRSHEGEYYAEYNREIGEITFTGGTSSSLRDELEDHIRQRIQQQTNESGNNTSTVDPGVERRLSALGYKDN